jgi:hypothetical protein
MEKNTLNLFEKFYVEGRILMTTVVN